MMLPRDAIDGLSAHTLPVLTIARAEEGGALLLLGGPPSSDYGDWSNGGTASLSSYIPRSTQATGRGKVLLVVTPSLPA
jgi:hypothetical protein